MYFYHSFSYGRTNLKLVRVDANNGQISSWQNLLHSLQILFGYSHFEDPQRALFKQTTDISH